MSENAPDFKAKIDVRSHIRTWLYRSAASRELVAREIVSVPDGQRLGVSFMSTDNYRVTDTPPEVEGHEDVEYGRTLSQSELKNIATRLALE